MKRAMLACVAALLPLAAACAPPAPSGEPALAAGPAETCALRQVSLTRLAVEDGQELYVEPVALAANPRGEVLLAGRPTYLWRRDPGGGRARPTGSDSVFGAVVAPDGTARTVRAPVPNWLQGTARVLGRDDGGWDVLFAELRPYARSTEHPPFTDSIARLWHGVYDGREWTSLEEIPAPPGILLRSDGTSALVRWGDTLGWAAKGMTPPRGFADAVVLFERRNGRWRHDVFPARSAYVALAHPDTSGPVLAVVGVDPTVGSDQNSLFLWVRRPTWRMLRRVVFGGQEGPVDHPSLVTSDGKTVLTWQASVGRETETRAIVGALDGPPDHVAVLDSSSFRATASLILPGARHLWVTNHQLASGGRELRFLRAAGREAAPVGSLPSPFLGGFGATPVGPDEVLLSGALVDEAEGLAVSLLLRVRVECARSTQ